MTDDLKITLPSHVVGSGNLERLVRTSRGYTDAAASENTLKAYKADWMHFGCVFHTTWPVIPRTLGHLFHGI